MKEEGGYEPDFIERNGAWLLSVLGIVSACCTSVLVYFLKSRCRTIKCCGVECERDVLEVSSASLDSRGDRRRSVLTSAKILRRNEPVSSNAP